jgi:hypothetical protein
VLRAKAEEMTKMLETIDARQEQIEVAEGRLTRADGLLMDVRAGMESLRQSEGGRRPGHRDFGAAHLRGQGGRAAYLSRSVRSVISRRGFGTRCRRCATKTHMRGLAKAAPRLA